MSFVTILYTGSCSAERNHLGHAFVKGIRRDICVKVRISNLGQWFRTRGRLKKFTDASRETQD